MPVLLCGFPVAFLSALPGRIYGIMTNQTLITIALFIIIAYSGLLACLSHLVTC
ncbi:MAG: hypothetical protein QM479_13360 [Pseudomonadota bacterium]